MTTKGKNTVAQKEKTKCIGRGIKVNRASLEKYHPYLLDEDSVAYHQDPFAAEAVIKKAFGDALIAELCQPGTDGWFDLATLTGEKVFAIAAKKNLDVAEEFYLSYLGGN